MYCNTTNCVKATVCGVAINYWTSSDVKIDPAHPHGNRLLVSKISLLSLYTEVVDRRNQKKCCNNYQIQ